MERLHAEIERLLDDGLGVGVEAQDDVHPVGRRDVALAQARAFSAAVPVTGIVVTKLDGTAKGGALVAVVRELGLPVCFIGMGEKPEDLQPFNAKAYARSVLGLST
jgi:signal recognition particle GTPase